MNKSDFVIYYDCCKLFLEFLRSQGFDGRLVSAHELEGKDVIVDSPEKSVIGAVYGARIVGFPNSTCFDCAISMWDALLNDTAKVQMCFIKTESLPDMILDGSEFVKSKKGEI